MISIKETGTNVWQDLMNEAYDTWKDKGNVDIQDYDDMLNKNSRLHKIAVLLGNLNYQVNNGGFNQWVDNGYALHWKAVVKALDEIDTPTAKKVEDMVSEIGEHINTGQTDKGFGANYWNEGGDYEMELECEDVEYYDEETDDHYYEEECWDEEVYQEAPGQAVAEKLDNKFYAINDDFMAEVATWFIEEIAEESN